MTSTLAENPYAAAQRFLDRNELPASYLDQVVQFIEKNTAGVNLGSGGNNEYVDPYTGKCINIRHQRADIYSRAGASRYQSSVNSVPTGPASSYVDPYTGASRYSGTSQPATAPAPAPGPAFQPVVINYVFHPCQPIIHSISSQITSPSNKQTSRRCRPNYFNSMTPFGTRLWVDILSSLDQLLIMLTGSFQSTMSLAMYPDEVNLIDDVFTYLNQALSEPPTPPTTSLNPAHLEAIIQVLDRWPLSQRFPGEFLPCIHKLSSQLIHLQCHF